MSRRNTPKLDLRLNLSPPRVSRPRVESPGRSSTAGDPMSPPSSCVSSELNPDESGLLYSKSQEATSMVLVGCPRCLMYVMLAEEDPKCPKCKSTVLLDVIHQKNATTFHPSIYEIILCSPLRLQLAHLSIARKDGDKLTISNYFCSE